MAVWHGSAWQRGYLSLIDDLCTHLLVLQQGQALFTGTVDDARALGSQSGRTATLEESFVHIALSEGHPLKRLVVLRQIQQLGGLRFADPPYDDQVILAQSLRRLSEDWVPDRAGSLLALKERRQEHSRAMRLLMRRARLSPLLCDWPEIALGRVN